MGRRKIGKGEEEGKGKGREVGRREERGEKGGKRIKREIFERRESEWKGKI